MYQESNHLLNATVSILAGWFTFIETTFIFYTKFIHISDNIYMAATKETTF